METQHLMADPVAHIQIHHAAISLLPDHINRGKDDHDQGPKHV